MPPTPSLSLLNQRAIVTGASRGIGLAIATLFAAQGASVTLVARNVGALERVVEGLPRPVGEGVGGGGEKAERQEHGFVAGSVGDEEVWGRVMGRVAHPTILINAAGLTHRSLLIQTPTPTIDSILATNLLGTILGSRAAAKAMIRGRAGGGGGCIVNIASVYALKGGKGSAVYAASKAGVVGFTRALATELAGRNIRVNSICPGYIDTEMLSSIPPTERSAIASMTPSGRLGTAEEVARMALFIATNGFVNGANLVLDGGLSAV